MFIDKKFIGILTLAFSAGVLLWANSATQVARADNVIGDRDYQLVTAADPNGGSNLYIYDNASGIMAVFSYDPTSRSMRPRAFQYVPNIFNAGR